jgi:hypothetical protein
MIKVTIEIRETNGSVTANGYATPSITSTPKEMQAAKWYMTQFDKTMSEAGATVQPKKDDSRN